MLLNHLKWILSLPLLTQLLDKFVTIKIHLTLYITRSTSSTGHVLNQSSVLNNSTGQGTYNSSFQNVSIAKHPSSTAASRLPSQLQSNAPSGAVICHGDDSIAALLYVNASTTTVAVVQEKSMSEAVLLTTVPVRDIISQRQVVLLKANDEEIALYMAGLGMIFDFNFFFIF